jgi:predicted small secreted protein
MKRERTTLSASLLTMSLVLVSATCCTLLSGCATFQGSQATVKGKQFQSFKPKGCHFEVVMPGTPVEKSGAGARRFILEDAEIAFMVSEENVPPMAVVAMKNNPVAVQAGLDGGCKGAVTSVKGAETARTAVVLGGGRYPGRDIQGTMKEPINGKFHYRFYVDPPTGRLYQCGVVGYGHRVDTPEVKKFLSSMQIF